MADDKKPAFKVGDTVELVAVERGFRSGKLVEPGRKFTHVVTADKDGKPRLPKWAQLADKPLPGKKPPAGDLKPADAQAAVREKAGQLAGGQSPGTSADLV